MTGFARTLTETADCVFVWEIRSVNARGLDVRFRLPPGFERAEPSLKAIAGTHLRRGTVNASLAVDRGQTAKGSIVDEDRLRSILAITDRLVEEGHAVLPRADGLLALKGVLEGGDADPSSRSVPDERIDAASRAFDEAVLRLAESRAEEGARLESVLTALVDRIERSCNRARAERGRNPEAVRRRISEQVERLLGEAIDEQRVVAELAMMAIRADVGEELDRLDSHVAGARRLVGEREPVGRRFDFLAQEMNREANTICSKSNAISLTTIGLDLKVAIDQLREQVQNIE